MLRSAALRHSSRELADHLPSFPGKVALAYVIRRAIT
jgi:hypothetical protein